jgi:hypothetical protein
MENTKTTSVNQGPLVQSQSGVRIQPMLTTQTVLGSFPLWPRSLSPFRSSISNQTPTLSPFITVHHRRVELWSKLHSCLSTPLSLSTYTSPTGYLQVVFTSDDNGTTAGFIASWSTPFTDGTTRARLSRVVIHPLYQVDQHYDVVLIELEYEILGFERVSLDDDSDLGFPHCKHPTLTTVGWWPSTQREEDSHSRGWWFVWEMWSLLSVVLQTFGTPRIGKGWSFFF